MKKSKSIEDNYISMDRDFLPLILTCPHDGKFEPVGVGEREESNSPSGCKFQDKSDFHTTELTNEIADYIHGICAKNVYVEIGICKRAMCDLNRQPKCAYETAKAKPCYDRYHNSISTKIIEIQRKKYFNHQIGILLDIHGFESVKKRPEFIIGTDDGKTIDAAKQLNIDIMWHPTNGFLTSLKNEGYHPDPDKPGQYENPNFNGGETVNKYSKRKGIAAIQIEVNNKHRFNEIKRRALAEDIASSILKILDLVKNKNTRK
jgi:N-formylglutamate amidohydrolase